MSSKYTRTIGETLTEYFGRHGLVRRINQASIVNDWAELVGEQVASVSEPDSAPPVTHPALVADARFILKPEL